MLTAAATLFDGAARPSVDAIARASGISRATFYRHFHGRAELLDELNLEPSPLTSELILETAMELVGRDGLSRLSMDEIAAATGVSRATLYRLFPGKPALFRELVRRFSPLEIVTDTLARMEGRPPEEVMPAIARAMATGLSQRLGIVRAIFLEVSARGPDAAEGTDFLIGTGIVSVMAYVVSQMDAGRIRAMNPLLALQSFAGPILLHLMTRRLAEEKLGLEIPVEDAVAELASTWVRAMRP